MKEQPKNHIKISVIEFRNRLERDHLCFYQISANQTYNLSAANWFTLRASSMSSIAPLGNDISIAIKCSILLSGN